MKKILMAYHTKTGSTKEVSEFIGQILSDSGYSVEVKSLEEIAHVSDYDGIVIGGPINGFQWVPQVIQFVRRFKGDFVRMPVAAFCLSYVTPIGRPFFKKRIRSQFEMVASELNPVATAIFGGISAGDAPMPPFFKWLLGIPGDAPKDTRDWDQIRALANLLGSEFAKHDRMET